MRRRQVQGPGPGLQTHPERIGRAGVERQVLARIAARLLQRPRVGVVGEDRPAFQGAVLVEGIVHRQLHAIMLGPADVAEDVGRRPLHRHDLVVKIDVEDRRLGRGLRSLPPHAPFHRPGQFGRQRMGGGHGVELRILHHAERGVVVAEQGQLLGKQVSEVDRGQELVVGHLVGRLLARFVAARLHLFETQARRDAPFAQSDLVVDVGGMGIGAVLEPGESAQHAGADRFVVDIVIPALADGAVADGDIMRGAAPGEALRVAGLDAQRFVVARLMRQAHAGRVDQAALAGRLVEVGADLQLLMVRQGIEVADVEAFAGTAPVVAQAGILERIGGVLCGAQAARGAAHHVVVIELGIELGTR